MEDQSKYQLTPYQYKIRHTSVNCFNVGESVFLRSNPEVKMMIVAVNHSTISVRWYSDNCFIEDQFYPAMLLQYYYSPLLIYKNKYEICLN